MEIDQRIAACIENLVYYFSIPMNSTIFGSRTCCGQFTRVSLRFSNVGNVVATGCFIESHGLATDGMHSTARERHLHFQLPATGDV